MPVHTTRPNGRPLTATVALALIWAGAHVALTATPMTGTHLIGGPTLIILGAGLIARLLLIAERN